MIETNGDKKDLSKQPKSKVNYTNDEAVLTSSPPQSLLSSSLPSKDKDEYKPIENVLILQGGGSLGAFGCGVFKALAKRNIKIDIVAGTSIGAVNAAIIAGGKDTGSSEQLLEQFWLELSDSYVDLDHDAHFFFPFFPNFGLGAQLLYNLYDDYYYSYFRFNKRKDEEGEVEAHRAINEDKIAKMKQMISFYSSAIFGNDKMFKPRWNPEYMLSDPEYFTPEKWTYLYDHSPLSRTLDKYIDYDKLNPNGKPNARLIITATNVLTAEPLVFDSSKQQITPKHILASSGYPLYNFPWIELEKGIYAWDGGLLSNTPLREVIDGSPVKDKCIFLVENYPKKIDVLPENLLEVYHRTRDIIFCDKTASSITMSKVISRYLKYIEELYQIVESQTDHRKLDKDQLEKIRRKYKKYKQETGAEIKKIFYISRIERFPSMFENADFSPETIKNSIDEGQTRTNQQIGEG
jgi:NTE family protein